MSYTSMNDVLIFIDASIYQENLRKSNEENIFQDSRLSQTHNLPNEKINFQPLNKRC
jgi:hypothetical protein